MPTVNRIRRAAQVAALLAPAAAFAGPAPQWTFAVSGDSRNCGNVVMPAIARGVRADKAAFYWHLGDLRKISAPDEDWLQQHPGGGMDEYLHDAWDDFEKNQIAAFGDTRYVIGIGNHETIEPKTRAEFITRFGKWLDAPPLRKQRLADDKADQAPHSWYHWRRDGIDFVYLDNATEDEFEDAQLAWLQLRLKAAAQDRSVRAVVVGMHEALPDSIAAGHSMGDYPVEASTGRKVYDWLLALNASKPVYVLASHSHFYMADIFNTAARHGQGVLKGWIVGTGGAVRYALPKDLQGNTDHKEHVYGYLLATVGRDPKDPVRFEFKELQEADVPAPVVQRYTGEFVHRCFEENPKR